MKKVTPVNKFHDAIVEFLKGWKQADLWESESPREGSHCWLYTLEEWKDRGEEFGNDAAGGTMAVDGLVYRLMNYGAAGDFPKSRNQWLFVDKFTKFCDKHGYHFDFGFAWSVHFYIN